MKTSTVRFPPGHELLDEQRRAGGEAAGVFERGRQFGQALDEADAPCCRRRPAA